MESVETLGADADKLNITDAEKAFWKKVAEVLTFKSYNTLNESPFHR